MSNDTSIWMPCHTGEYLRETMAFDTAEEHGVYHLLCIHYWEKGLPNDEKILKKIAKISEHKWKKISEIILKNFVVDGDVLRHSRLDRERGKSAENKEKQAKRTEAATEAARLKRLSVTDNVTASVTESPSPSPISSELNSSSDIKNPSGQKKPALRGCRLAEVPHCAADEMPDDWETEALKLKPDRDWMAVQWVRFWEYFNSVDCKKPVKKDWQSAWRGWCKRDLGI